MKIAEATLHVILLLVGVTLAAVMVAVICIFKSHGDVSKEENRKELEEKIRQYYKSPCEDCLRWSECNGVDPDCPVRNKK